MPFTLQSMKHILLASILIVIVVIFCSPSFAQAASISEISSNVSELEERQGELNDEMVGIDAKIAETDSQIEQIKNGNSEYQTRYDQSLITLYKMQNDRSALIDMFLKADSLDEMIEATTAYSLLAESCINNIEEAKAAIRSVQDEKDQLTQQKEALQIAMGDLQIELDQARILRDERQGEMNALLASADNSDLARYSASMAYSKKVRYCDGYPATEAYKRAWETILPGDSIPCGRSCDRGIMIPIRMFGLDNTFPTVCTSQFSYMQSSDKWVDLGLWNGSTSSLQPGDVLVSIAGKDGGSYDHSCMYVGYDIAQEMYDKFIKGTDGDLGRPDESAVFSSASYQWGSSQGTALCLRWDGEAGSHVFRCVRPDK